MKKAFIFLVCTFFSFGLGAQSIGLRAGANVANLTGDIEGQTSVVGWQFGPFVEFELSEYTDFNIAFLYSKKGSKDELTDVTGGLKYLEIPVMFRYNLSPLFIQLGVYGSYLTAAEVADVDVKELFKDGDYGFSVGAGISLGNIRFDGRYSHGFANINDIGEDSIKNAVFTFGAEFSF